MHASRIIEEIDIALFEEIVSKHNYKIEISQHAQERIAEHQRNVFKAEMLYTPLTNEKPCFFGIQKNKRYSVFFRRDKRYLRIIFKIEKEKIQIITFTIEKSIPLMKK